MVEVFVHATLTIRIGKYAAFCEWMARQKPVLEQHGQILFGAWVVRVGRICTVIHVWRLRDANTFFDATAGWRESAEFAEGRAIPGEAIESELVEMMEKTPYCP